MNSLRIEGQKTVGIEIVRQFEWEVPDWIVIPVGNLGNISALYKGFPADDGPRFDHADAEAGSGPSSQGQPVLRIIQERLCGDKVSVTAQDTLANAIRIGDPVSYAKSGPRRCKIPTGLSSRLPKTNWRPRRPTPI